MFAILPQSQTSSDYSGGRKLLLPRLQNLPRRCRIACGSWLAKLWLLSVYEMRLCLGFIVIDMIRLGKIPRHSTGAICWLYCKDRLLSLHQSRHLVSAPQIVVFVSWVIVSAPRRLSILCPVLWRSPLAEIWPRSQGFLHKYLPGSCLMTTTHATSLSTTS